jgi:hypothetical protein
MITITLLLGMELRLHTTPPHPTNTTTETFKALPGNPGSVFLVCNLIFTQLDKIWNIFSNIRRPKICASQPKMLIFGMQPYFDTTRWNMEDDLNIFENGKRSPYFCKWRTNSIFFKWKMTSIVFKATYEAAFWYAVSFQPN